MPLCTGAEGGGEAYLGVVVTLKPPLVEVTLAPAVVVPPAPGLLDDPHPAAKARAEQAIRADTPRFIALRTLA